MAGNFMLKNADILLILRYLKFPFLPKFKYFAHYSQLTICFTLSKQMFSFLHIASGTDFVLC